MSVLCHIVRVCAMHIVQVCAVHIVHVCAVSHSACLCCHKVHVCAVSHSACLCCHIVYVCAVHIVHVCAVSLSACLCCVTYWKFNMPSVNVNIEQSNIFLNKLYNPSICNTNYAVVGIATRHGLQGPGLEFQCDQVPRTLRPTPKPSQPPVQSAKYI
jgi:hypothetical protein